MENVIKITSDTIDPRGLENCVNINDRTIIIDTNKISLNLLFIDVNQDVELVVKCNRSVSIAESYQGDCKFRKKITVKRNAILEKITFNNTNVSAVEEYVEVWDGSMADFAFSNLSDGNATDTCVINLVGNNASANIINAAISAKEQVKIVTSKIIHKAKNTKGNIDNFGVSKDHSNLVFNGWGVIEKGQINSEATQTQKIMIFDKNSRGAANPFLLIDENDVVASHAAAIGQMNPDHLYYLQSRGLSVKEAKELIILGYIMPVVDKIKNDELRESFYKKIKERI